MRQPEVVGTAARAVGHPVQLLQAGVVVHRVGPQNVAQGAHLRRLLEPFDAVEFEDAFELGGNAAVEGEELAVDDGGDGQPVEGLHEHVVDLLVELLEALVAEVVVGSHLPALVVSAEQENGVGVRDLQGVNGQDDLDPVTAAVHVVPQEQVLRGLGVAAEPEDLLDVVELPMDVPDHRDRVLQVQQVGLGLWSAHRRTCSPSE